MAVVGTDILFGDVDYELAIDDATTSEQVRILRGRALEAEEEERRRRRRQKIMQMNQAAASIEAWRRMELSRGGRLIDTLMAERGSATDVVDGFSDLVGMDDADALDDDAVAGSETEDGSQNTEVADGLSLALGSDAHRDYLRVREGFDGFDLERAHLAELGFGTKENLVEKAPDDFHEEYDEATFEYSDNLNDDFEAERNEMRETTGSRILRQRVTKDADAEHIIRAMQGLAKGTRSLLDDEFVDGAVSREVDLAVANDSVPDLSRLRERVEHEVKEFDSIEVSV